MKKRIFAMILGSWCFLLFVFYMMIQAQSFEIIDIGEGRCPRFAPDSKKIGFLSQGWLCLANSDGTGEIHTIASVKALDFKWMSDSTLIYWSQDFRTKDLRFSPYRGYYFICRMFRCKRRRFRTHPRQRRRHHHRSIEPRLDYRRYPSL